MPSMLAGLIGGLTATVPMTIVMELMQRQLPAVERRRRPLPPRRITDQFIHMAGADGMVDEQRRRELALINHFAYGAAVGAAYGPVAGRTRMSPVASGVLYGLAVWAGSFSGWLPATGILPPPTRQPARRNVQTIASHIVWGAALGLVTDRISRGRTGFARSGQTKPDRPRTRA